tara:strand:+ start:2059 stop:3147 length:1089 start_codon:yes stop_codon:yes gene_type:complete
MQAILVAGAGKIGKLIACLLSESGKYQVHLVDSVIESVDSSDVGEQLNKIKFSRIDITDSSLAVQYIQQHKIKAVICCLPFHCNVGLCQIAKECSIHYFDLTEDTEVTKEITKIAQGSDSAIVPQCGLAPGFISIVAHDLMTHFDSIDKVLMRVGALPANPNNILKYSLNWSTEGLINEYGNTCYGISAGVEVDLQPLEGLETLQIDGLLYEAFNTSGGIGSLALMYKDKVNTMNYKTLRYPGHCEHMRLLMNDLKLNDDRETLKHILEKAIPRTKQDVVLIYAAVNGYKNGEYLEENYVNKIYPQKISGKQWSAIQVTTAASACVLVDHIMNHADEFKGLVYQENIGLECFLKNDFGRYYR